MCMPIYVYGPWRPEEEDGYSGAGVKGGCKLSFLGAGISGLLQEQAASVLNC